MRNNIHSRSVVSESNGVTYDRELFIHNIYEVSTISGTGLGTAALKMNKNGLVLPHKKCIAQRRQSCKKPVTIQ